MRYRKFGNTGLLVSELCLGTTGFGGGGFSHVSQSEADRMIGRAIDAGINFIDAAPIKSDGQAETITGQGLSQLKVPRDLLVVASRLPRISAAGASRYPVMDVVIASLRRLRLDYIDLYRIDGFDDATPVEETVRTLEHLVQRGRLRCVGVSSQAARQIMETLGIAAWLRLPRFEPVEACSAKPGLRPGLAVWNPPAAGAGGDRAQAMRRIAQAKGISVARLALAWLLHQDSVTSVVVGADRMAQLEDHIAATTVRLDAAELAALSEGGGIGGLAAEDPDALPKFRDGGRRPPIAKAGFGLVGTV